MAGELPPNDIRRFKGEEIIGFKNVPALKDIFLRQPTYETVRKWHVRGVWVSKDKKWVRLRARQEGGQYVTSVEAVKEFQAILNREGK